MCELKNTFATKQPRTCTFSICKCKFIVGELHVPLEVCGAVVKRELDFWQISELHIKSCCWRHYRSYIENKRILDSFNKSLKKEQFSVDLDNFQGWTRFQMRVWLILEHPRTSRTAMVG